MDKTSKALGIIGGIATLSALLAWRSHSAQAADDARGDAATAFDGMQSRPLPESLDAMTPTARADALATAQQQLAAFGTNVTDALSTLGSSTRAAFDAWRAAHPGTGPGDIGVIASIDDAWRAAHQRPAVTTAPLGR